MFEAYYSQLNTPCLVVDEPMTRENIKRMHHRRMARDHNFPCNDRFVKSGLFP